MKKFDPMDLTLATKSVCGFNLSFFSEEKEVRHLVMSGEEW